MDNTTENTPTTLQQQKINVLEFPIPTTNAAFNLIVLFVRLAYERKAFSLEESGKISECLAMFKQPTEQEK